MRNKWVQIDRNTHRYNDTDFQALAFHISAVPPQQQGILPQVNLELPPKRNGWILVGDFPTSPIQGCAEFPDLVMAKAYAETRFHEYRSNMARTGMTPNQVKREIIRIRLTNDANYLVGREEHIASKTSRQPRRETLQPAYAAAD